MTKPIDIPVVAGSNFIVDLKTAIIKALRATFDNIDYPDREIEGIKIQMEYPLTQLEYPCIWVQFSLTKLQNAGIGHLVKEDYDNGILTHEWMFNGTVRLN